MFKKIARWVVAHRAVSLAIAAVLVLVIGALIAWPILRSMETRQLALAATQATELMEESMNNPAIFTGDPDDAAARLSTIAEQLARLHDGLVLAHVYFAPTEWRATKDYTEFTERYALKLAKVAASIKTARDAVAQYDSAVSAFKFTNAKDRMDVAAAVNQTSAAARHLSELAYQDCVLVHTLTTQVEATTRRALLSLSSIGPDATPSITALLPRAEAAATETHAMRKQFNPMARPAF
jgi:hypothetical protein